MIYYECSRSGAMISDPGGGWVMRAAALDELDALTPAPF
jgi:hypothetical protein